MACVKQVKMYTSDLPIVACTHKRGKRGHIFVGVLPTRFALCIDLVSRPAPQQTWRKEVDQCTSFWSIAEALTITQRNARNCFPYKICVSVYEWSANSAYVVERLLYPSRANKRFNRFLTYCLCIRNLLGPDRVLTVAQTASDFSFFTWHFGTFRSFDWGV